MSGEGVSPSDRSAPTGRPHVLLPLQCTFSRRRWPPRPLQLLTVTLFSYIKIESFGRGIALEKKEVRVHGGYNVKLLGADFRLKTKGSKRRRREGVAKQAYGHFEHSYL